MLNWYSKENYRQIKILIPKNKREPDSEPLTRNLREPRLTFCSSAIQVAHAYQQKGSLIEGPLKPLGTILIVFQEALKCSSMMPRDASFVDGCTKRERSDPQDATTGLMKSAKFPKTFYATPYAFWEHLRKIKLFFSSHFRLFLGNSMHTKK